MGPAGAWEQKRHYQVAFLRRMGLQSCQTLLDLGCGTLRGGIPLIGHLDPGNYVGVEVRPEVLAEGRLELAESGLDVKQPLLVDCADLSTLALARTFDVVWAFSVLIHMEDGILHGALAAVRRHLADDGVFYANVNVGVRPDGNWQGFPVVTRDWPFYEQAFRSQGLAVTDIGSVADFGEADLRTSSAQRATHRMLESRPM
ncbi:MAG: class I SAM-dependent methyltransferase [Planctomycetia bacterium]|nr:class I SAM-dependent methyltransferase [Planctomycetia bacterium]